MKNKLQYCNVQFVFQTKCKISNFFTFKDKIPLVLRSGIVYKFVYKPDFEDFSILATNNNDFKVTLMESLLINRDHPPLNKNKQSLPLELSDS